ncbi:MAG: aspartate/glutamate racemase family protein [Desulfobacteraceae bacterium]|nr:aspartate/glutamate racemase family protein [Desulfobacteraceae bacterium]
MKTIGLIGGMSWESSAHYYREINEGVKKALGGLHSAQIAMVSLNFDPIERLQHQGEWAKLESIMTQAAQSVEAAGANFFLICTNTMHKLADKAQEAVKIPLLHIADATAQVLVKDQIKKIGLLGTAFTMEQGFYKDRLTDKYGLDVVVPGDDDRQIVHDIIYRELCLGQIRDSSKKKYLNIVERLAEQGAQGIILGCTEIGMLIKTGDTDIPIYDTTQIHAAKAVENALIQKQ